MITPSLARAEWRRQIVPASGFLDAESTARSGATVPDVPLIVNRSPGVSGSGPYVAYSRWLVDLPGTKGLQGRNIACGLSRRSALG